MDILKFIVDMANALTWPATVLILAMTFRHQIRKLLARLVHLKAPGVEVDFSEKLDQVEAALPARAMPRAVTAASRPQIDADLPPAYIIQNEWRKVEDRLQSLYIKRGGDAGRRRTAADLARFLDLPADIRALVESLRSIRDAAVHADEVPPTVTDALRYSDLVGAVLNAIPEA